MKPMSTKNRVLMVGAAAAAMVAGAAAGEVVRKDAAAGMVEKAHLFLPIFKVDAEQRLVYARITDETIDLSGEICDYDSSAPLFLKWSENAKKVTGGKSAGNLRSMHGPTAAGKLIDLTCDEAAKAIDCVAKVVDDAEWEKVKEGVYTGLSLGGRYVGKKWKDEESGAWRYTVDPVEVSLVDLPCNPSATFAMVKADGVEANHLFKPWEPSTGEVAKEAEAIAAAKGGVFADHLEAAKASLIAKRAGVEKAEDTVDEQQPAEGGGDTAPAAESSSDTVAGGEGADSIEGEAGADAVEGGAADDKIAAAETDFGIDQVFRVRADGTVHEKKADAKSHVERLQAVEQVGGPDLLAAAIAKAKKAAAGETVDAGEHLDLAAVVRSVDVEGVALALKMVGERAGDAIVVKSMYSVSRFADILCSLASLQRDAAWEAEYEGDSSPVPAQLADGIKTLAESFKAMADEELAELLASLKEQEIEIDIVVLADQPETTKAAEVLKAVLADEALVQKIGARNSKTDAEKIQAIHDLATKLGCACGVSKAAGGEAETVEKVVQERDALKAQIEAALPQIEEMGTMMKAQADEMAAVKAQLAKLGKEPEPMPQVQKDATVATRQDVDPAAVTVTPELAAKALAGLVEALGPDEVTRLMVKAAQARPMGVSTAT
jgi:hypothetical protein